MPDRPDALMLFAAGFGTRMGALTRDRPKPLIEVAGRPLIDHAIGIARDAGIGTLVANAHYHADRLAAHLEGTGIAVAHEQPDILDTGGGLRAALPLLGPGPVLTLNTDAVWQGPNPIRLLLDQWDPDRMEALLMLVPPDRALGHDRPGDFAVGADDRLVRGPGFTYSGLQVLRPDRLHDIPETVFSLNRAWDGMLADGTLFGLAYPGRWCDVGHPEGIPLAESLLRHDVRP